MKTQRDSAKVRGEEEIVRNVARALMTAGYRVRTEVPNMGQSADIVATRNRWLTAVEVKVSNWRRALQQCKAHEVVADYICVAIGSVGVAEELEREARRNGYGLLHCPPDTSDCVWIVRPKRNSSVWRPQRATFARRMKDIVYEN